MSRGKRRSQLQKVHPVIARMRRGGFEYSTTRSLPGWRITFHFVQLIDDEAKGHAGVFIVDKLRVEPAGRLAFLASEEHGTGINGRLLRRISFSAVETLRQHQALIRRMPRWPDFRANARVKRRGAPAVYSVQWYKQVRDRYRELPKGEKFRLAEEFGLKPAAMRKVVQRLRETLQLLPPTGRLSVRRPRSKGVYNPEVVTPEVRVRDR
jgi:hypothetical protein